VEHPLAMDVEAMRRAGYATVDALVAPAANAPAAAVAPSSGPDLLGAVPLLADSQPAVKARIAATLAERLQNR
jgi:hypothetical protein